MTAKYWFAASPLYGGSMPVTAIPTGTVASNQGIGGALALTATPSSVMAGTATTNYEAAGSLAVTAAASGTLIVDQAELKPVVKGAAAIDYRAITLPDHVGGDLIVIVAFRDGSTILPAKPIDTDIVPVFIDIDATRQTTPAACAVRTAYAIARHDHEESGSWSGATGLTTMVISGHNVNPVGGHGVLGGTAANSVTAPGITLSATDGTSLLLQAFGHRTVTAWGAAPSGYTRWASHATEVCLNTKDVTTSDGQVAQPCTTSSSSGCYGAAIEVVAWSLPAAIDAVAPARMEAVDAPGMVVATTGPKGDYIQGYGALNADDHIRIGSLTKTFTACAVLQQIGLGNMALSDTLSTYVSGVTNGNTITIEHLLSHRSGVYDFATSSEVENLFASNPTGAFDSDDALALIRSGSSQFTPGSKCAYCNSNYVLLGFVLEAVTSRVSSGYAGRTVVTEDVVDELDLPDTSLPATAALPEPYSLAYSDVPGLFGTTRKEQTEVNPEITGVAGAMVSTAADLLVWGAELRDRTLLTSAMKAAVNSTWYEFTTAPGMQYGLGIIKMGEWRGHAGGICGFMACTFYHTESGTVLAFSQNLHDFSLTHLTVTFPAFAEALYPGSTV